MEINKIFELSRKFQNKNQEEIAHEVNIDRSAIAHFEAGRYKLSINMMGKIARVLNISKAYIDGDFF
ncbi:MAG: helix-turn-helix transcriptional regulator [Nitrospinae bacterium]|nr:helix-turn-helix transcriptional regulator [Nitrospinota bacterium]